MNYHVGATPSFSNACQLAGLALVISFSGAKRYGAKYLTPKRESKVMNNQSKPHQKDLRKGRYSNDGQIYHITTTTINREPIFAKLDSARKLINILRKSDELMQTNTFAFVVMPDHIHWLFQLNQVRSISKLMQSVKSISARSIGRPIWQAGYYDHAVRKEEDLQTIARYIVANPMRAGLVNAVGDYPHWDAVWV